MTIKKLDRNVSLRIAAGEVIERPASVAKELIENSIDAGAKNISLAIEQGGKVSFVIEDDGCGIPFNELPLAVERYATSKISVLDDLEHISTLGYRGEALASVASVSHMEIRSRYHGEERGGVIRCDGGKITLHSEISCQQGTRIQVDDLFFNLPARRKFLKTASAELRRILQIVNDYAIIRNDITFRVVSDGKKILEQLSTASIDETLKKRWGQEANILYSQSKIESIAAMIWWNPLPDSRRVSITTFVNQRRVKDSTIKAAVCASDAAAYGEWLVVIDMPPELVDVNIHPAKEEVRFRHSQDIFKIVYDNVQSILTNRFSPNVSNTVIAPSDYDVPINAQMHMQFENSIGHPDTRKNVTNDAIYNNAASRVASGASCETIYTPAQNKSTRGIGPSRYIGQTARGFLLYDFQDGLAILDPHAAHERILYEQIKKAFENGMSIQNLAIAVEIPAAILAEVVTELDILKSLGFIIKNNKLTGVPLLQGHGKLAPIDMLRSTLRGIETENDPAKRDREVWWRLARLACKDAVKLGAHIEPEEAEALLARLGSCEMPFVCPHGRPTVFIIDNKKLEEMFER
jgi:DNA mismatch repair protein MutL